MYDIGTLQKRDKETKEFFKQHFVDFFKEFDYKNLSSQIVNVAVNSHDDLNQVRYGTGLYFILSNYQFDSNPCTLKLNGLKVIYRGHGVRIRKRVESHIYNDNYNQDKDGTTYSVCMKLDGNNGINLSDSPYAQHQWAVVYHPMTNSTKTMREQAELAFDEVYNMPFGSNA